MHPIPTPNAFAYLVLFIWPIVVFWLFKNKSIQAATFWSIVGGYMWLPMHVGVDLPLIPALNKETIPALSAWLACILMAKQRISIFGQQTFIKLLVIIYLFSPTITALLNSDPYITPKIILPGVTMYDAVSVFMWEFIRFLPFILGRHLFRTAEDQILMFRLFCIGALIYAAFILLEIRLSPQLHVWVYGIYPSDFIQQVRDGGFRAVVFMGHGLLVALYLMIAILSATVLWELKERVNRFSARTVWIFLFGLLILQKSMAALVYAVTSSILIKWFSRKSVFLIIKILLFIGIFYPILSMFHVFPHESLVDLAASISKDRAGSLTFRFANEQLLLEHAEERLYFGWGSWGRNRVYSEGGSNEFGTTDGTWIITLGQYGLVGFFAEFGLIAAPILHAIRKIKYLTIKSEVQLLTVHTLMVAWLIVDQIPNASLLSWVWLIIGALQGRCENIIAQTSKPTRKTHTNVI